MKFFKNLLSELSYAAIYVHYIAQKHSVLDSAAYFNISSTMFTGTYGVGCDNVDLMRAHDFVEVYASGQATYAIRLTY